MSPDRGTVLLFGEGTSLSHVVRPAVLARALQTAGFEAHLACDERYHHLLSGMGLNLIHTPSLPTEQALDNVYNGRPLIDADTLDGYVREDLRIISEIRPDVVVGDLRQSLAVSARLKSLPLIAIANAQWSPYSNLEFELAENPLIDVIGDGPAQLLFKMFFPVGSFIHTLPINVIRSKYGLPWISLNFKDLFVYGDYVAYPDIPEIVPSRGLPANHIYLGPILWSPKVKEPDWWTAVPTGNPIVYVNLGSSGQKRLLESVLEALANLPVSVIAGTAGRVNLASAPSNAYLADYLPGSEAASRAALTICNGGTMSGQQSLAAGTPMLGLVSNMDQLIFSKAVSKIGAGDMLRERDAGKNAIKSKVEQMLSRNSYRQAAERIADACQQYNAEAAFVTLVEKVVRRVRTTGAKSASAIN